MRTKGLFLAVWFSHPAECIIEAFHKSPLYIKGDMLEFLYLGGILMKSFFSLFSNSANELKKITTLTVCGMLMALCIVLRNLAVNITADLRITFSFFGIMIIAMLYGPVVCVIANVGVDVLGYFLDGFKARDYNFGLLAVKILMAIIYGVILYNKQSGKAIVISGIIARIIVVILCNLVLNSCVLYYCYTNKNFPFMTKSEWDAFKVWFTPRLIKNVVMLPIEMAMIGFLLPAVKTAYNRVFKKAVA